MQTRTIADIDPKTLSAFRQGVVVPAMPLALDANRRFDPRRQRALCRYYVDAGAGGVAVGVHSTQFAIRDPKIGLFEPVLRESAVAIDDWSRRRGANVLKIAGICGRTEQAEKEADFALSCGYDAGLLSLAAWSGAPVADLLAHCRKIAARIPVVGFYLQPAAGGRLLSYDFWRAFADIDNVLAIKIAPFNRYQTIDVVRGVAESGREISLYTGNDDNILLDLLTEYRVVTARGPVSVRFRGGLLGHWCCWTRRAVEQLRDARALADSGKPIPPDWLTKNIEVTDANAAFFDPANGFAGCIPGIHEVLRRQGLLAGTWCLDPEERLSPGQSEEIDRVTRSYPHLADDDFVAQRLAEWMGD